MASLFLVAYLLWLYLLLLYLLWLHLLWLFLVDQGTTDNFLSGDVDQLQPTRLAEA